MLGDVGGLYDFISMALAFFVGLFSERLFIVTLVKKLFMVSEAPLNDPEATPQSKFDSIAAFKMNFCEQLLYALSCGGLPRGGKKRVLSRVRSKVEKQLDLVTMIKQMRAFNALLRLYLTDKERNMIHLQRRDRVIELGNPHDKQGNGTSSSDGSDADQKFLKAFWMNDQSAFGDQTSPLTNE